MNDVPVTIIGGGPIGMSMALALGRLGVASRLVERNRTTTQHPKARGCWPRSMEIFRFWGVEETIRARGLPAGSDRFIACEGLAGAQLGSSAPEPDLGYTPSPKSIVAQDAVEETLLEALKAQPLADIRFGHECVGLEQTPEGVAVRVDDLTTGHRHSWKSAYLIGADGAGGSVAPAFNIGHDGPPPLATMLNVFFRCDLSDLPFASKAGGVVLRPSSAEDPMVTLLPTDPRADRWLLILRIGDGAVHYEPQDDASVIALIRRWIRDDTRPIELINTAVWRMARQIADRFRADRVFLAGDAAHRFPPTGGFGMNSGVQDVHNLAWKIALVLNGKADQRLLDTYDVERRPAAHSNADFSLTNAMRGAFVEAAVRSGDADRIQFWLEEAENHLHSIGQSLGFVHEEGAVVSDGSLRPAEDPRHYRPNDRPGGRFPHFWVGEGVSSIDLSDGHFLLVAGAEGQDWIEAAQSVAQRRGLPLRTLLLQDDGRAHGLRLGARGAVLVRPDGVTAWRCAWRETNPAVVIDVVFTTLLGTA